MKALDSEIKDSETTATKTARCSLNPNLTERLVELMKVGSALLPVWVRAPVTGPEHYTGFGRAKLYELAQKRKIRSVSIREPHQTQGTRLFNLASILNFIEKCETGSHSNSLN
jgi:hypothetical protein